MVSFPSYQVSLKLKAGFDPLLQISPMSTSYRIIFRTLIFPILLNLGIP